MNNPAPCSVVGGEVRMNDYLPKRIKLPPPVEPYVGTPVRQPSDNPYLPKRKDQP